MIEYFGQSPRHARLQANACDHESQGSDEQSHSGIDAPLRPCSLALPAILNRPDQGQPFSLNRWRREASQGCILS